MIHSAIVFSVVETSHEVYTLLGIVGEVCVTKDRKPVLEVAPTAVTSELNIQRQRKYMSLFFVCSVKFRPAFRMVTIRFVGFTLNPDPEL